MLNSYTSMQYRTEMDLYDTLAEMLAEIRSCERKAEAAKGGPIEDEYNNPGPLSVDEHGNPVQDVNYWATFRRSLVNTFKIWVDAYTSMFPDNKERNNGVSILHRLEKTVALSADPDADA